MADPVTVYGFEWDQDKAAANRRKHGVAFEEAATVFLDARASSLYDAKHSETEDRWATLGLSSAGRLLVVWHTFEEEGESYARVRIISSRKATRKEEQQYGA